MLKPDDLGRFGKYMGDRRATFERIVTDNLDLAEQIEGGIFENLDLSDNKAFTKLLDVSKPLRAPSAPKPLSDEQRAFYTKHAPEGLELDALTAFGPINVAKLKFRLKITQAHEATVEMWFYPDSTRILELSTKCASDETFQVLAESRAVLKVSVCQPFTTTMARSIAIWWARCVMRTWRRN